VLGRVSLRELRAEDLAAHRDALYAARAGSRAQALCALRSFLVWGAGERLHSLTPEVIRGALRPPGGPGAT
jgi:hypothetical protein